MTTPSHLFLPRDVDLVSFDVFDTLVLRVVGKPSDVFELMAQRRPDLFPPDFAERRIQAEVEARKFARDSGLQEISLLEIYSLIFDQLSGTLQECMEAEIETEISLCRPREDVRRLFHEAIASGRRVIAISDMYLPVRAIAVILENCGYGALGVYAQDELGLDAGENEGVGLYVSSRMRATKHSGQLFDKVGELEGVAFRQWLHIGDSERADISSARRRGIRTIHTPLTEDALEIGSKDWVDGIYRRVGTIVAQSNPQTSDADAFWQEVATAIATPLIAGLCAEVRRKADELGAHSIYFLARDGAVIQKAYEVLYPADPRPHIYLHASRRVVNFTAITQIDGPALKFLSGGKELMTLGDILARIGIDDPILAHHAASAGGFSVDTVNPRSDRLAAALKFCEPVIVAYAAKERARFLRYLESVRFDQAGTALVVDVGWFCSIQRSLQKLAHEAGWPVQVAGIYVGTKPEAYDGDPAFPASGWLYHKDGPISARRALDRCTEFVELLFAAPENGIVGIEEDDGSFRPIRHTQPDEETRIFVAERLHEGVVAACRVLVEHGLVEEASETRDVALRRINSFLLKPRPGWVEFLMPLRHSVGFGASNYRSFVRYDTRWRSPRSILNAILTSFWREGLVASAPRKARLPIHLAVTFGLPVWRKLVSSAKTLHRRLPRLGREAL